MDKDVVHIYSEILLSHEKGQNCAICRDMDGSRDYHIEQSKSEREKQISYAAAAAKSLQLCPTLCDPIDGSLPGSAIPEMIITISVFVLSGVSIYL